MPFDNRQQVQYQPTNGVAQGLSNALRMYSAMNSQNPKTPDATPTAAETANMMNGKNPAWTSSMPQQPVMQPTSQDYALQNNALLNYMAPAQR